MKLATVLSTFAIAAASLVSAKYTDLVNGVNGPVQYAATNYAISPSPLYIAKPFCLIATGTISNDIVDGAT
ncbi:hypothetical protein BGZ95_003041 [Linnemannia exigua]|uniref:Uncharacterized protein n=1 Tax=Linnemannia exigua TaxID=604196 RepID=A0AAD4D568_9FUNG|nr:hypothetical protein BGZ95_003041 [Linnemannia exigua]